MVQRHPYLVELTRALLVLALVLFSLPHRAPQTIAGNAGYYRTSVLADCGPASGPEQIGHAPCHACRTDGIAVLPPPPSDCVRAIIAVTKVIHPTQTAVVAAAHDAAAYLSRGPPAQA